MQIPELPRDDMIKNEVAGDLWSRRVGVRMVGGETRLPAVSLRMPHTLSNPARPTWVTWLPFMAAVCAVVFWSGCWKRPTVPDGITTHVTTPVEALVESKQPESTGVPPKEEAPPQEKPATPPETPVQDEPVEPATVWNSLFKETHEHLQKDALEKAAESLAKLKEVQLELTAEQTEQLAAVRSDLDNRTRRRRLRAAIGQLASKEREDVEAAQNQLYEDADAALPLLRESLHDKNPLLVKNSLEMLRRLRRPDDTLPIMVGVLRQTKLQKNWPDAIRQIELIGGAGAGEPLLNLAESSELPEQRIAALTALAAAVDPPPRTTVALLPMILGDGPELPAALLAVSHAVCIHGQHDLWSGRGLAVELSPEQLRQIYALPERLSAIMASGGESPGDAARAAKVLAVATRQIPAEPILGVRVLAFGAEMKTSPAVAVLDGVWNSTAPGAMWRYPIDKEGSILFDLGSKRTVVGVRVWNLNESNGGQHGWKDVAVYIGSIPTELVTPAAKGVIPPALGKNNPVDYSVTVPVNFAQGRYVRLRAENTWSQSSHTGLTEVQILGF